MTSSTCSLFNNAFTEQYFHTNLIYEVKGRQYNVFLLLYVAYHGGQQSSKRQADVFISVSNLRVGLENCNIILNGSYLFIFFQSRLAQFLKGNKRYWLKKWRHSAVAAEIASSLSSKCWAVRWGVCDCLQLIGISLTFLSLLSTEVNLSTLWWSVWRG